MSNFNDRVFNILLESSKTASKSVSKAECGEECADFQDTIGNGHNFSDVTVPNKLKFTEDNVAICKAECGSDDGGEECCKEAYFIDGRLLDIYMADNNISDDALAVEKLCEYYNLDMEDVYVVVECDEVNKGLIEHSKKYLSCGLLRRCNNQIKNCINAGIKVVKRS